MNAEERQGATADRDLRSRIAVLPWHHQIDFGNGTLTSGLGRIDVLRAHAGAYFRQPVAGKSVLNIGCWDGFNSFQAHRLGATRVFVFHAHRR